MQNTTILFIYELRRYDGMSSFRDAENVLSIAAVWRIMTCGSVHKVLTTGEHVFRPEKNQRREEVALRNTRHDRILISLGPPLISESGVLPILNLPGNLTDVLCSISV